MIVEFSVVPVGVGEELAAPVARVLDLVDQERPALSAHGDGDHRRRGVGRGPRLIRRCHEAMRGEAARVLTHIAIDDRAGASGRIEGKVRDVEAFLGRDLRK